MADLLYFDRAFLYNKYSDDEIFIRWFEKFLNATPSCGGALISDELPKEEWEVVLIEWVKNEVKKCMRYFNRSKMIDIPISMIYIVPEKTKYTSIFVKGIVVERSSNECYFAVKVFQEIFCRTSFCQIISEEDKKLSYVDGGTVTLKKGIASFLAREFLKQSIKEGLFEESEVCEEFFDLNSEKMFSLFLKDFCLQDEDLSRDECFNIFIEAVINEKSFSQIRANKNKSVESMSLGEKEQKVLSTN
jgi:hypothetical protein